MPKHTTAATLAQHCPGLYILALSGTQATLEGVETLRDAYPALSVTFDMEEESDDGQYEDDEERYGGYAYEAEGYGWYGGAYGSVSGSYDEEYDGSGYDDEYE
jgi:hypothetical protein